MVAIHRQLAILDPGHGEGTRIPLVVLHLDLGAHVAKLLRHVFQVIGEGQGGVMRTEGLVGFQHHLDAVTHCGSFQRIFDLFDQIARPAMYIADGIIDLLHDVTCFIVNLVDNGNHLVLANHRVRHKRNL